MNRKNAILYAVAAALFYAVSIPFSKLFLQSVGPTFIVVLFGFFVGERPTWQFYPAVTLMIFATVLMIRDSLQQERIS